MEKSHAGARTLAEGWEHPAGTTQAFYIGEQTESFEEEGPWTNGDPWSSASYVASRSAPTSSRSFAQEPYYEVPQDQRTYYAEYDDSNTEDEPDGLTPEEE